MNEIVLTILEILKYTIPALIVFITVYLIMKKYLQQQFNLEALKFRHQESKNTLPLKLQSYERLALFCERIKPDQLIFRLNGPQMNAKDLRNSMLIAIQKEYEHNLTQQIYVSEKLWEIINFSKNEIINLIGGTNVPDSATSQEFAQAVMEKYAQFTIDPLSKAQSAIKKETELIL